MTATAFLAEREPSPPATRSRTCGPTDSAAAQSRARRRFFGALGGLLLAAAIPACGEDHDDRAELLEEMCVHLEQGPSRSVIAAGHPEDAPDVSESHTRFDVAIGDSARYVRYEADEATDFLFGYGSRVTVRYLQASEEIDIEETLDRDLPCPALAQVDVVPLAVGSAVLEIRASAATESQVRLVVEEDGGDHDL